jgi:hypothetical protein
MILKLKFFIKYNIKKLSLLKYLKVLLYKIYTKIIK